MHVDTTISKGQRSRDVETVCEYRHLVTSPVTVGVLKNLDLIVALALCLNLVRIIHGLRGPKSATFIPGQTNRIYDLRLGGK